MKLRNSHYPRLLPALAVISLSAPTVFGAIGIWQGAVGGADGFWDASANTEWSGVTGNAWNPTNGPNNIAQFNAGTANTNPGTSGAPVVNGIIWNGVGGGISSGAVTLAGSNPFISVVGAFNVNFYGNLQGTAGFTKIGSGTINLDGAGGVKSITGGITVNQGGLRLTMASSPNVANSSNTLNLSGSQLEMFGNGSQTLSSFTLGNGGSRIFYTPNGASNSTTLSLANWTRVSNSSIMIDTTAAGAAKTLTLTGTLPTLTNSLIGGYATVRDSGTTYGFATLDGSNNVVRYTGATAVNAALGANTVSTTNYRATAAGTWFNGSATSQTLHSLEIAVAGTVSGNNSATYILGSGGLLFSDATNATNGGLANMTFTSATSELQISTIQFNSGWAPTSVRGVTDNGATSVSLIKGGTGGLSMASGTFTYSGDTIVNQGTLANIANIPRGSGRGNLVVNALGTVTLGVPAAGGTRTINGLSNTTLGGGIVNNATLGGTAGGAASAVFLDLGNNNATASFSGVITGVSVIKSGTGTQTFSGINTYAGSTAVNAGRLTIAPTGTINSTSAITIGAGDFNYNSSTALSQGVTFNSTGGALSGTGTITPAITVTSGNRQTAGTSVTAANPSAVLGKQAFTNGITFNTGSLFEWNLNSTSVGSRGVDFDAVNTASLAGSGAIFRVVLNGSESFGESFWNSERTWTGIFRNLAETTTYSLSGVFSGGFEFANASGSLTGVPTTQGSFSFVNGGQDLRWTVVPEPTSALAGLLLGAGLLRRRRTA